MVDFTKIRDIVNRKPAVVWSSPIFYPSKLYDRFTRIPGTDTKLARSVASAYEASSSTQRRMRMSISGPGPSSSSARDPPPAPAAGSESVAAFGAATPASQVSALVGSLIYIHTYLSGTSWFLCVCIRNSHCVAGNEYEMRTLRSVLHRTKFALGIRNRNY